MRLAFLLSAPYDPQIRQKVQSGEVPRQDYLLISEVLGASLIAPVAPGVKPGNRVTNFIRRSRIAWAGFRKRKQYDLVISDLENVGMILALLFKLSRSRKRHVMICHGKVSSPWSIKFMKLFGLSGHIDRFVCYGPRIAEILQRRMPSVSSKVSVVYHPADHKFWKPQDVEPERLISAAGMFYRDYPTLIEAVRDLDVSLHVAGFSPWMAANHDGKASSNVPANVTFGRMTPVQLRDLYARSLFVALPLTEANSQAGSLVVYEAMATGKAVVVTNTRGQQELKVVDEGVTGVYVKPGDVKEWRAVITRFLENPSEAIEMGNKARETVERGLNMDRWAEELAGIVRSVAPAGK
jgi:glycosyltransferase involved in cell wall biosynthesis